ncbi:hypothetical protein [Ochrobactrum sp. Marseille-Q0166]|uniref:hypothetical protein n=1 Tax=Ochrobactrum sp. Marseille-Q0166 TaxID=2761105 RepID=UPI001656190A|nr:hypothetical protein [Ochrobactrum sp. Marseille-Q0166]MBC8717225.1 hypothetical protein [Ochrobactrum sp. Marseille-Q0166]
MQPFVFAPFHMLENSAFTGESLTPLASNILYIKGSSGLSASAIPKKLSAYRFPFQTGFELTGKANPAVQLGMKYAARFRRT